MTGRGKKAILTGTEICYTRKQSKIKSAYIFEVLGWNLLNPTLSAIPKTTKIHESPQSLELSGLFLFLRFKNTHEKSQTATKKGATLGASNVAPVYFKQELLPMPEKLTDTAIRGAKPRKKPAS